MSPGVVNRKLAFITTYLKDIKPYGTISFEEFMRKHYEIERLNLKVLKGKPSSAGCSQ
jgi:hypothetical protein